MSVGVLLITHDCIGSSLVATVSRMLSELPLALEAIDVPCDCDPEVVGRQLRDKLETLDSGDGVLLLTDIYGGTPSNIACSVPLGARVRTIAGVNLPMLVRVLNYPGLSLTELADKALTGGREGVYTRSEA